MSELTSEVAAEIVAACKARAAGVAAALSEALEGPFEVTAGEAGAYDVQKPPVGFDGPGLVVLLRFANAGAVFLLPESTGLLPPWFTQPDAAGEAKLNKLAKALNLLLVPDWNLAEEFRAARVGSLAAALERAGQAARAEHVPMRLARGDVQAELSLIWPVMAPDWVFDAATEAAAISAGERDEPTAPSRQATSEAEAAALGTWPHHMRNVLRITVPVTVTLASQRTPIHEIIELGPGTIVKFEKTCDQPLELNVGDRPIATGEVVKVGDKFGLRIGTILKLGEEPAAAEA